MLAHCISGKHALPASSPSLSGAVLLYVPLGGGWAFVSLLSPRVSPGLRPGHKVIAADVSILWLLTPDTYKKNIEGDGTPRSICRRPSPLDLLCDFVVLFSWCLSRRRGRPPRRRTLQYPFGLAKFETV